MAGIRTLPAEGAKRKAPALPRKSPTWLAETREWWKTLWASPMAVAYVAADVPTLIRLARLVDDANRGEATAAIHAEIRQLEDRFGLSPMARRRLQWEIEQGTRTQAAHGAQPRERGDDPRRLRVVA